ncbi:hypothetical protein AB9K17_23910, partial [Salmonella enterica subsp. enterica serovar Kentucky]|uniref:hypothetical protein n=1 Tax=Salmonella enterica TaxID=28901 RepID=UPI003F4B933B
DTGGQPEFQDHLPDLVAGPSLYFLFFRLDQDLNRREVTRASNMPSPVKTVNEEGCVLEMRWVLIKNVLMELAAVVIDDYLWWCLK